MRNNKKTTKILILFYILVLIIVLIDVVRHKEFFINLKQDIENQIDQQQIEENINLKELEEEQARKEKEYLETENILINITQIALLISIPIFLISVIIKFKIVYTKNYDKSYENLIDPVLAEILVDDEIDFKSLIMTIIIELHLNGNLNIINNEYIELLNFQNIEPYHKKLLNFIFEDKKIVTFKEINNIFKKSKEKTLEFSKLIDFVKQSIIEKLYNTGIYSRKKTAFSKIMTMFSIIIMINLPMMIISNAYSFLKEMMVYIPVITGMVIYWYIRKIDNQLSVRESFTIEGKKILENKIYRFKKREIEEILFKLFMLVSYPIAIILVFVILLNYRIEIIILFVLTIILNICVCIRNKGYCLTNKGYKEKYKILKFKKYINEYSLIKDRDLHSVLVWDKYLAYATAFEIPNNVTDSIYKQWYDININIQFIETIVKLFLEI